MYSDAENLLSEHPTVETVEALITDCNGAARGKWLPVEKLPALMTEGIKLPKSAVAQDIWGRDVPRIALENGDIDGWCQVVPNSLVPVLGNRGVDRAQVILSMVKDDGTPCYQTPARSSPISLKNSRPTSFAPGSPSSWNLTYLKNLVRANRFAKPFPRTRRRGATSMV